MSPKIIEAFKRWRAVISLRAPGEGNYDRPFAECVSEGRRWGHLERLIRAEGLNVPNTLAMLQRLEEDAKR